MRALAFFVVALLCVVPAAAGPFDSVPGSGSLTFGLWRGGSRIGAHSYVFRQMGDDLIVEQRIDVVVHAAFVTLYRYSSKRLEMWRDGRLTHYEADTNDDGKRIRVQAHTSEGGLSVTCDSGVYHFSADAMPLGLWNPAALQGGPLFGADDGQPIKVTVQATEGDMVARYRLTGDVNYVLSYVDAIFRGAKIAARDGSTVEYVPE